ncbi:MAG TPA: CHAD domain-containing protein [Terracidiphilus sp.]|jgi:CHAD domain-containing protein
MDVDTQSAVKPLRKLRKLLKDFPPHPSPEQVHSLRTNARKLEAIVHTFSSESDRQAHTLLKLIKPIRKAAGKARDMDVFIARLHQLKIEPESNGLVRLTEHIAQLRQKRLARLHLIIASELKLTRRVLKRYVRWLGSRDGYLSPAAPQVLAEKLDRWPKLHAANLHDFRIHAKELRYMLQLFPETTRQRMDALGELKDKAGEWHDWLELHSLAKECLDPAADRDILDHLRDTSQDKLRAALGSANRLRKLNLDIPRAA